MKTQALKSHTEKVCSTFSVHMSTHLSTDMFCMTAVTGRARETLSGFRKQPLNMALPSATETQDLTYKNHTHIDTR